MFLYHFSKKIYLFQKNNYPFKQTIETKAFNHKKKSIKVSWKLFYSTTLLDQKDILLNISIYLHFYIGFIFKFHSNMTTSKQIFGFNQKLNGTKAPVLVWSKDSSYLAIGTAQKYIYIVDKRGKTLVEK